MYSTVKPDFFLTKQIIFLFFTLVMFSSYTTTISCIKLQGQIIYSFFPS